jgi:hypothetical protein
MSTHTVLLVIIGPLVNLVLFGSAWWIAQKLAPRLREGRLKAVLFANSDRNIWVSLAAIAGPILVVWAIMWWVGAF